MIQTKTEHQGRRWTPLALAILSVCLASGFGFIGWCGDSAMNALKEQFTVVTDSIQDLKSQQSASTQRLWNAITSSQSKLSCVENQLTKCCPNSTYCG